MEKIEPIKLIRPSIEYADQIKSYRQEFLDNNDSMDGTSDLKKYENPFNWLHWLDQLENKDTCPTNFVPSTLFILVRSTDHKILGMISIRHHLNGYLFHFGGNIGYSIRKSERNKGYAKEQLRLALLEAKKMGLDKVLITCLKGNIASAKTILANGGIYEDTRHFQEKNEYLERYWINL